MDAFPTGLLGTTIAGPPVSTTFWTNLTSLQLLQLSGGGPWPDQFTNLRALTHLTLANNSVGEQQLMSLGAKHLPLITALHFY
jgi:hypothetical protein